MAAQLDNQEIPGMEFDLLDYILPLLRWWKIVILVGLICAAAAFYLGKDTQEVFEAYSTSNAVGASDIGGVAPDERRAPEVITLVEHGFIMNTMKNNQLQVTLARLRSRSFSRYFMEQQQVHQAFHPQYWNSEDLQWRKAFELDRGADLKRFNEEIRVVEHNPENDVILIKMRWHDPAIARDWANAYVAKFNDYMRKKALGEIERRQQFLQKELRSNDIVDLDKSIYRLVEAQTALAMLVNARDQFALEILDPATLPYQRFSTSKKKVTLMSGLIGGLLCIFAIMAQVAIRKLINELKRLSASRSPDLDPEPDIDVDGGAAISAERI